MDVILRKRAQELELKRKDNLTLTFEKRSLEGELVGANRKILNLNRDIQTIHNELNTFAESFESKLESAIAEKDARFEEEQIKIETLTQELDLCMDENQILSSQLHRTNLLLGKLSSSLRKISTELVSLKKRAAWELDLKVKLKNRVTGLVSEDLYNEIYNIVGELTVQSENEVERVRKDNTHLSKELEALRHEMAAEEMLGLSERLIKTKEGKGHSKLFTQNTLLLDFPKLVEDLMANYPDQH